ncbi:hypothetical protein GCM10023149_51360 [Mucilaginibacter gynuensis]|uniref:DUF4476 domain-containing protein n=1 Tax=Mucilaginibacter gynuensis TaxID=1302236 RepID=A0ABP8HJN2_9SPHI
MKRIFYTLSLLLLVISASAQSFNPPAEVFIAIRENGNYTIKLDDQFIGSRLQRFRFFEVQPGRNLLTISQGNRVLYKDYVSIKPNTRLIAGYSAATGLKVTEELDIIVRGKYNLDNWNNVLFRPEEGGNGRGPVRVNGMEQREYAYLYNTIKAEAFDSGKLKVLKVGLKNSQISTGQLTDLLKMFTFDDKRLESAVFAYNYVSDARNFYQVRDTFTFESGKREIDDLVLKK